MALLTSYHPTPVYLVDFSVYKPPEEYKLDRAKAEVTARSWSVSDGRLSSVLRLERGTPYARLAG